MRYHLYNLLPLIFVLLIGSTLSAQTTGSISGRLTDNSGSPVSYATVTLLRPDSSVANGDLSKDDGSFRITAVAMGSYTLRVESIGFSRKLLKVTVAATAPDVKTGTIKLTPAETSLKTVNVTAEKKVMELKVDKKVFNVEKNTTTAGGSASDVLQNVPAVSVDGDGGISLRGKSNVTVLIDGKPATMLGTDVASALQSMPASSIESVEVITNPSARYDAQGTTGIINIITKKDVRIGLNGNLSLGAGTRDKYNANLGLNMRRGKWNFFINSSFRQKRTFNNVTTDRQDTGASGNSYYTYEHVPRLFTGFFNTLGATYDLDKNNSFTLTQNVNTMQWGYRDWSDYYVYTDASRQQEIMHRDRYSDALGEPLSFSTSLDYRHKFKKKGEEINIDATYATNSMTRSQNYRTAIDTFGVSNGSAIVSSAPGSGGNSSLNVWADYVNPITESGKLGMGFKSQFYNFYSSNEPRIWTEGDEENFVVDSILLTKYNYNQQIHAAYVNWSDQKGQISYQAGLRLEDAEYDGTGEVPAQATFHNSFLNLFPSAFVSWQFAKEQSLYVNYSRRTNRPGFFQMMPFKDLSNPGTVFMGNPDILPEFIDNVEFSYNYSGDKGTTLIFSAYFAQTNNLSERVITPITGTQKDSALGLISEIGQLLSRPLNIASGVTYGLEGTSRFQFTKAWDATLSANFFNNQLTIGQGIDPIYLPYLSNNNGYGWFAKANTNIKLPAGFSLQFNGNYESPKVITQGRQRESYWLDVALRKNLLKNKATLVINCSDVFKTRQFINEYNTPTYVQTINRVKETRIGNINFTWRFGGQDKGGMPGGERQGRAARKERKKVEAPTDQDRANNLKSNEEGEGGGR